MGRDLTQFGIMLAQWGDWARYESMGSYSTRYKTLIESHLDAKDSGMIDQLIAELAPLSAGDRADLMCNLMRQIIASVLKADAETVELDRPVTELGIDSLMATEIQMSFESNLGLSLSVLELIGDVTIRMLATRSLETLEPQLQSGGSTSSADDTKKPEPPADGSIAAAA